MCGNFHEIQTSTSYIQLWKGFLRTSVQLDAHPAFFQFATDRIFKKLVEEKFPVSASTSQEIAVPLSREEQTLCVMFLDTSFARFEFISSPPHTL